MATFESCAGQHFDDWPSLRNYLFAEADSSHVWRGVANIQWCILSSLDRFMGANYLTDRAKAEYVLRDLYATQLTELGLGSDLANHEDALWALGQHFGLPTPLLDWSLSPMVAVFFAITGTDPATPPRDRVAGLWRLNYDADFLASGDVRRTSPSPGPWNARLRAQRGVFTRSTVRGCLIDVLNDRSYGRWLEYVSFPATLKSDALRDLGAMMIDDMTLFPDQTGVVRNVMSKAANALGG